MTVALNITHAARGWLKANWTVLFNASAVMGTRLIQAFSGIAFWWLAARTFIPEQIALAGAMLTAMELVSKVAVLGINTLLAGEVHHQPNRRAVLISTGLLLSALSGGLLALVFGALAPQVIQNLQPLASEGLPGLVIFVVGVAVATVMITLEDVLIGLLLGGMQVLRGTVFALARLLLLVLLAFGFEVRDPIILFVAWFGADLVSALAIVIARWGSVCPGLAQAGFSVDLVRSLGRDALKHHLLNILLLASGLFLPQFAAATLAPRDYATFYIAWVNDAIAFTIPYALVSVLYAVGNAEPTVIRQKLRQVALLAVAGCSVAIAMFWLIAPWFMSQFGRAGEYGDTAATLLRIFILGLIPVTIKGIFTTLRRMEGRMLETTRLMSALLIIELGTPLLSGWLYGLYGFAWGWLAGQFVLAAIMLPSLLRALQHGIVVARATRSV
jgi:O-antigen/teichoic acid export membrane protein